MSTKQFYTIGGIQVKYWLRRAIFIGLPFCLISIKLYSLAVNFLLALGLR